MRCLNKSFITVDDKKGPKKGEKDLYTLSDRLIKLDVQFCAN